MDRLYPDFSVTEESFDREHLAALLGGSSDTDLFAAANKALGENMGMGVYLRGLVELSNVCRKNCLYCGLRRSNPSVRRYTMPFDEVTAVIRYGYSRGLRSFVIQSGELPDREHIDLVERILTWTNAELGDVRMVLSMGELPRQVLDRLKKAGAHRYLLRIESSSHDFYSRFHPSNDLHSYRDRLDNLAVLRETGWQTGTGEGTLRRSECGHAEPYTGSLPEGLQPVPGKGYG